MSAITTPATPVASPATGAKATSAWAQSVASAINGIQAGSYTSTSLPAGSSSSPLYWSGNATVTFPTPYTAAPILTATHVVGGNANMWVVVDSVTATGFTFHIVEIGSAPGSCNINWVAMPSGTE